jgi:hypothetical protein
MTDLTTPRGGNKKARTKCFDVVFTVRSNEADSLFSFGGLLTVCERSRGAILARRFSLRLVRPKDRLLPGKSTPAEVQSIFGRFRRVEQRRDGFIGYYEIEVYNPFEDTWGRGKR